MTSGLPHQEKLSETPELRVDEDAPVEQVSNDPTESGSTDKSSSDTDFPNLGESYEVICRIGQGGMGRVFKVRERSSGKFFAVKVLQPDLAADAAALKRFEQEAESASQLDHANLVSVYGHGTASDGAPYIVMDFLQGSGLSDVLKKDHHLEPKRALEIFIQICEALKHAHDKGVIHRDIKPTNIILTSTTGGAESAHIVDFGIAKAAPTANRETHNLTQTGEIFGSPQYMSPEQCLGFMLDSRSDIYSLGCLMYEVLTGGTPFEGANPIQLVVKHINEDPPGFPKVIKGEKFIDRLESVVLHCLEKDKTARYQTIDEVLKDLYAIKAGKPPSQFVRSVKPKRTYTSKHALGLLVLFAAVASYLFMIAGVVETAMFAQTLGIVLTTLSFSGIYVFYTSAFDTFRKNKARGLSEKTAWSVALCTLLGTTCLSITPVCLIALFDPNFHFVSKHLVSGSFFTHFGFAVLSGIALICFLAFRSKKLAKPLLMSFKYLVVSVIVGLILCYVVPAQTGRVIYSMGMTVYSESADVARTLFQLATTLNPKDVDSYLRLADLANVKGDVNLELSYLDKAYNVNPQTHVLIRRAKLFLSSGKVAEAFRDLDAAEKKDPGYSEIYYERSKYFFAQKRYAEAMAQLENKKASGAATISYAFTAKVRAALGRYESAISDLNTGIYNTYSEKDELYLMRAMLLEHLGHQVSATKDYQEVVKQNDTSTNKMVMRSYALHKLGTPAEAHKIISDANFLAGENDFKKLVETIPMTSFQTLINSEHPKPDDPKQAS